MKVATNFVSALTAEAQAQLEQLAEQDPTRRIRMRAHSLLLSAQGTPINEIARIYQVHRNSVSSWIDQWHQHGVAGLADKPRPGGPSVDPSRKRDDAGVAQGGSPCTQTGVSPAPRANGQNDQRRDLNSACQSG